MTLATAGATAAIPQQTALAGGAPSTSPAAGGSGADPLGSLSTNFSSFLQLLMTQLKNQDPTSPLDTNQFTSELVQFTSVEQQINTNSSLKQLIQLTQGGEVVQSTSMLGHKVGVQSDHLSLQGGSATVQYTMPAAGAAEIVVTDDGNRQIFAGAVTSAAGANTWNWNGKSTEGNVVPDGAYRISVTAANADGTTSALPFTVIGTATGVQEQGSGVQLELGALPVDFSKVRSVLN